MADEIKYVRPKKGKDGRYHRSLRISNVLEHERKKLERNKLLEANRQILQQKKLETKEEREFYIKKMEEFLVFYDDKDNNEDKKYGYIYGLFDPVNFEIKYIGQSIHPRQRYKEHIRSGMNFKSQNKKDIWIRNLGINKLLPTMGIIEKVLIENIDVAEKFWIKHYTRLGYEIVNSRDSEGYLLIKN